MLAVLKNRNFRLLWIGECVSLLGDQFYILALPWLVLRITGDPLAMGAVLATTGIPRALFAVVGGAMTDRFSPRAVMLWSNIVRGLMVALLSALIFADLVQVWMLYLFALGFGIANAFYFPAMRTIVPSLVEKDILQSANALIMGVSQLSAFVGPVLAGLLIAVFESGTTAGDTERGLMGIAVAFAVDAVTFLVSALTLWWIQVRKHERETTTENNMIESIREGFVYLWSNKTLRSWFFIITAMNLFMIGPFGIGIPVLADTRFDGAVAFGLMLSGFGAGAFTGTVLAGVLPRPRSDWLGTVILLVFGSQGIGLIIMGLSYSLPLSVMANFSVGLATGYSLVYSMTWFQSTLPENMMGRVLGTMALASNGIQPLSRILAGAFIASHPVGLFVVSGGLFMLIIMIAFFNPDTRKMGMDKPLPPVDVREAVLKTGEHPAVNIRSTGEYQVLSGD